MASFALGDLIVAEPEALIGFAGPRVIKRQRNRICRKGFSVRSFCKITV